MDEHEPSQNGDRPDDSTLPEPSSSTSTEEAKLMLLLPHPSDAGFSSMAGSLLPTALSAAVPLWVCTIVKRGGPSQEDWARLPDLGHLLAEKADHLLSRSAHAGETAELFNALAQALALLSFVPHGVSFGELHFEAGQILTGLLGEEKAQQYVADARHRKGEEGNHDARPHS